MQTLKDKNILVIGATGGIGSRTVKLLADSGANLF
jgi:NAD(P)-dependent dehydrogenase (short-subunit alcohol dehydrogenase family)